MRMIITGGCGCLGSNLVEHWLPLGHDLLVLDNFATGKREIFNDVPGLTVVEGSVADENLIAEVFEAFDPEIVVHSAASYKDPLNWKEDVDTNVAGSVVVAKESLRRGVRKLINFQTALCYGRPRTIPVPSDHPTAPFTSYGVSKTAGEAYLLHSGLPVISLRLANICGPRLAIGPIPTFYKRLKAGQSCFCSDTIRDFLDISDFLSLMDLLISLNTLPCGVFNVSSGEGHSIKNIYDVVERYLGINASDVPILPPGEDDVPSMVLDPSETEKILGWRASVSFETMIEKQLRWYDDYGVSDVFSHLTQPK